MNTEDKNQEEKNQINEKENSNKNNQKEELDLFSKRSYSCRFNEEKKSKLKFIEDIKLDTNKINYLRTPKVKLLKSKSIPTPLDIGTISLKSKKAMISKVDNDNLHQIISEGENENLSEDGEEDSSSDNNENENFVENDKILTQLYNQRCKNEQKCKEDEEMKNDGKKNDDYHGDLPSLKILRKNMMNYPKNYIHKNENDDFYDLGNKDYQKYKKKILSETESVIKNESSYKSGFLKPIDNFPILSFLKNRNNDEIKVQN